MTHVPTSSPHSPSTDIAVRIETTPTSAPTDALNAALDPGFVWLTPTRSIIASGVAARIPAYAINAVRSKITASDDLSARTPMFLGALPFADTATGTITIPARVRWSDADGNWFISSAHSDTSNNGLESDSDPALEALSSDTRSADVSVVPVPSRYVVCRTTDQTDWEWQITQILHAIATGTVTKTVLAREVFVESDTPFDIAAVLHRLQTNNSGCFIYADHYGATAFVGASPELLIAKHGAVISSRPMAGSVPQYADLVGDAHALDALRKSAKDNSEHRFVVDAVVDALRTCCSDVHASTPDIVQLATVAHLATHVTATATGNETALDLALALHPTPAVAGTPRDAAVALLRDLEGFDRGRYAGPVGWMSLNGDGEFAIGLRSADINGCNARLVAGAGIVEGSDAEAEWAETQAKLEPMLRALVRP
jgi:menaquinone-specific isochorismate synthase